MKAIPYTILSKVWIYPGDNPWHFVTVEKEDAVELKKFDSMPIPRRGFGSIPVNVTIGETKWKTSIFPQKDGSYVLPLKKEVRVKEHIKTGDTIKIILEVLT